MKLNLDENCYVTSYVIECNNYDEVPGVEYAGDVPDDFSSTFNDYRLIDGVLELDEQKSLARQNAERNQEELYELYDWFDWYDEQVAQYNRCVRLGEPFDRDITELDALAKSNQHRIRDRIRELKGAEHHGNFDEQTIS